MSRSTISPTWSLPQATVTTACLASAGGVAFRRGWAKNWRKGNSGRAWSRQWATGRPLMLLTVASARYSDSTTPVKGMAYISSPKATSIVCTMARVRGKVRRKVVPCPASLSTTTDPPSCLTLVCTTSRPTPRPDTPVTRSTVDRPGRKMSEMAWSSSSWEASSSDSRPRLTAARRMWAGSMPRPSSCTVMMMWPSW